MSRAVVLAFTFQRLPSACHTTACSMESIRLPVPAMSPALLMATQFVSALSRSSVNTPLAYLKQLRSVLRIRPATTPLSLIAKAKSAASFLVGGMHSRWNSGLARAPEQMPNPTNPCNAKRHAVAAVRPRMGNLRIFRVWVLMPGPAASSAANAASSPQQPRRSSLYKDRRHHPSFVPPSPSNGVLRTAFEIRREEEWVPTQHQFCEPSNRFGACPVAKRISRTKCDWS